MKKMLPVLLAALVGLTSCSKTSDDTKPVTPTASIVGTWNWTAERSVVTPKNGGATTSSDKNVQPGALVVTYASDGQVRAVVAGATQPAGTYTVSGTTLTTVRNGTTNTSTISELSANRLVLVNTSEDSGNRYTDTDTFAR